MKRQLIVLAVILLLAALLTLLLGDYSRQWISPLLYLAWVGRLLLAALPQVGWWALLLAVALFIAGRTLLRYWSAPRPPERPAAAPPGRIESWSALIRQADQELYYQWQLAQPLQELTLALLAHTERVAPADIKQRLNHNDLELPPDIQTYLQASLTSFSHLTPPRPHFGSASSPSPLALEPDYIIRFLEEKLDHRID
jgi:hypothetical protein